MLECWNGRAYERVLEWYGICRSAGVAVFISKFGSGTAHVRVREWYDLYKNAGVA